MATDGPQVSVNKLISARGMTNKILGSGGPWHELFGSGDTRCLRCAVELTAAPLQEPVRDQEAIGDDV